MKTKFQVLSFLHNYTPKSPIDHDIITSFVDKRYGLTPKTAVFAPQGNENTLDGQSFVQWYGNGVASLEVAKKDDSLVLVGNATLGNCQIIAQTTPEGIKSCALEVPQSRIVKSTESESQSFREQMAREGLSIDRMNLVLCPKYIPQMNDKVLFSTYDESVKGMGVVAWSDPETFEVGLYCYFIYPNKADKVRRIGYSMNEEKVVNLRDYIFEPMLETSQLNGVSCLRRMNRELEKEGYIWKDKLHRIEPVNYKLSKGKPYWYINDKLKVVQCSEEETPTHHFRYLAGNYFHSLEEAMNMQERWADMLRERLVKDSCTLQSH